MRIVIDTDEGAKSSTAAMPAAATAAAAAEVTGEGATDGGSAPTIPGGTAETVGDPGSDGGGPPQALLDAISAAEAAGLTAVLTQANEDLADGGAAPSAT